jgi:hypothetical protein
LWLLGQVTLTVKAFKVKAIRMPDTYHNGRQNTQKKDYVLFL